MPNLRVNDLVLVRDDTIRSNRRYYPKAVVIELIPDRYNVVRRARIRMLNGTVYLRDIRKLVLLEAAKLFLS